MDNQSALPDIICPFMTARVTKMDDPNLKIPTITPTIIKCQRDGCQIWDKEYEMCSVQSSAVRQQKAIMKIGEELIKIVEKLEDTHVSSRVTRTGDIKGERPV